MSTPIEPLVRERVEERHDHRIVTAWVRSAQVVPSVPQGHWLARSEAPACHVDARDPGESVLVMLRSASAPVMAELSAHVRTGARLYVLAPSGWVPTDPVLRRHPSLLVRRVAEVPASAVHTVRGAALWAHSSTSGSSPWRLRLDDAQGAALRQLFLRLFWHEAVDEAWGGAGALKLRPAAARPFDVPEPHADALVRWMPAGTTLGPLSPEHRVHLEGAAPSSARVRRLWLSPSGAHHAALARLVREGATVVGDERGLPDVATNGRAGVVLLPGTHGRLRVELSPAQAAELAAQLDAPAAWSFRLDVRLGDHVSDREPLWLEGEKAPRPVEPQEVIELPAVQASALRGMDDLSPSEWSAPDRLSLSVRYRWMVRPPRVPAKAREDALVARWRELDERWAGRVEVLGRMLSVAEADRGRIASAFARLAGAILGFGRTHDDLQRELLALAALRPSHVGPKQAHALLQRLVTLEDGASRLHRDQGDAEHQARVDDEQERQRAAWETRVAAARREHPGKRDELQAAEDRRAKLEEELAEVDRAREAADLGKQARKDLKARRSKLGDELERLPRRLGKLRAELVELERRIDEPFSFTAPERRPPEAKGSSSRFVPAASAPVPLPVPEEALPEVGALRSLDGQRYLVIDAWEDLEPGEAAARRLGAGLCTTEDA